MAGIVKRWKSCAMWPDACCPAIGNYSEDTHETKAQADAVCAALRRDGFGGDGKFFPIRTWTEEINSHQVADAIPQSATRNPQS